MKKLVMFAVMGLVLSATAFAEVMVLQDGKTMSFKDNSQIVVSGKTASRILYNGVLLIIPANIRVSVQRRDGKVLISGNDMKDVEVVGKEISSKGYGVVSVDPITKEVVVVEGNVKIKNAGKGSPQSASIEDFPGISKYLNEVATQQANQDVERQNMSQSTVSGN